MSTATRNTRRKALRSTARTSGAGGTKQRATTQTVHSPTAFIAIYTSGQIRSYFLTGPDVPLVTAALKCLLNVIERRSSGTKPWMPKLPLITSRSMKRRLNSASKAKQDTSRSNHSGKP